MACPGTQAALGLGRVRRSVFSYRLSVLDNFGFRSVNIGGADLTGVKGLIFFSLGLPVVLPTGVMPFSFVLPLVWPARWF
jgi:hypothetical protein